MRRRQLAFLLAICTLVLLLSFVSPSVHAKVTGPCANCHTMHNSQGGNPMALEGTDVGWLGGKLQGGASAANAAPALLVSSCLGCHSSHTSETIVEIGGSRVPIVYNLVPPAQSLAGGNFYWVQTDDTKGHNIFPENPDDKFSTTGAPGDVWVPVGCFENSCHHNFDKSYEGSDTGLMGRKGCTGCHMLDDVVGPKGFHHADDSATVVGSESNDSDGYYRFLKGHAIANAHGVAGIEDADWEQNPSSTVHNEYLGKYEPGGNVSVGFSLSERHTITAFCCGCHGNFHKQEQDGTWIRHPSDAIIPNSGEYIAYTIYDPNVPVARQTLTTVSSSVTAGTNGDLVMCLSCHRPHGSPYPDMLRWNYEDMEVGSGGSGGCFTCHTQKN